jgi:hypothetical protein
MRACPDLASRAPLKEKFHEGELWNLIGVIVSSPLPGTSWRWESPRTAEREVLLGPDDLAANGEAHGLHNLLKTHGRDGVSSHSVISPAPRRGTTCAYGRLQAQITGDSGVFPNGAHRSVIESDSHAPDN